VKRFAKIILAAIAGVAALLVLVLIGINLYLQSGDVQNRIRLATEQAIGMPVTVKSTFYTPWSGLTLSGLSLPDPTITGQTLADAPEFSVQFEFLPLLSRHFVISEVSLDEPHLTLRQTEDRQWVLAPPRHRRPRPVTEVPAEAAQPAPAQPSSAPRVRAPEYTVELKNFYIRNGHAEIIDYRGQPLARVNGLNVDGSVGANGAVRGSVWIEDMEFGGQIYPNRLRAEFAFQDDHLAVTDVKCAIADGKVRAEFHMVMPRNGLPEFQLKSEVQEVSVPTLIAEAHGNDAGASGKLVGHFNLRGNPLDVSTLTGGGEFSLDSAQLRPLGFIQQLGAILRIDELQTFSLQQALLRFELRDERFWITDLTLRTDNLIITGTGPIRFNGKMNLKGRFMVNEKIQRQLGGLLPDNFTPSEDANYKQVAFNVTGRLDRPNTDLIEKVTGTDFRSMGGLIKGLFRMPKPAKTPEASPSSPAKEPASS
jgi:hypothetical protein